MRTKLNFKNRQKGFLVLTMVLLVSVTVLAIATGILLRSISQVNQTGDSEASLLALNTVNACGDQALLELSTTTNGLHGWSYAGNETITVGDNNKSCYIYPIVASGTSLIIQASSTIRNFTRKIEIEVATNTPRLIINSWDVVANF